MIRAFQIGFLICLLFCLTSCISPQQGEFIRLKRTYGVKIHHIYDPKKFFPSPWLRPPVSAKGTQITTQQMDEILPVIERFLSKYPEHLLRTNLSDIYLLGRFEFFGAAFASCGVKSSLYLSCEVKSAGFCELPLEDRIHSAFSTMLLRNYTFLFPTEEWKAIDPNGPVYMSTLEEILAMKAPFEQTNDQLSRGFLVKCSQNNLNTDFAMLSVWNITRPQKLHDLAAGHDKIRQKLRLAEQFYASINDLHTSTGSWKKKKSQLQSKYGIDIVFDNIKFPKYWKTFEPKWTPIPRHSRWQVLNNLQIDLAGYEPSFLKENLNSIFLCRSLEFNDLAYGGTTDYSKKWIYLTDVCLGDNGLISEVGGFHHELSSILLALHKNSFPEQAWRRINQSDFEYVFEHSSSQNLTTDKTRLSGNEKVYLQGFVGHYGQLTFEDDVNTYAQYFIAKTDMLEALARKYPLIKQKSDLLKSFYEDIGF